MQEKSTSYRLDFRDNQLLYIFENEDDKVHLIPEYRLNSDTLTILFEAGTGCELPGQYIYSVSQETLTISPFKDDCKLRQGILVGAWTRDEK